MTNFYARIALLFAGLFCVGHAIGALTVTVASVNQTQAVLQEQGFSGDCTILLSTALSMTPLHPDVNGAEYSGANTDTGRGDTITSTDGNTRLVTLGHQNDDRALAVYTTYYYQVSGCGDTVSGKFTTANLSIGTTRTEQSPFNASKWGNLGLPTFDWTKTKSYVDPMTGVSLIPMALSVQTWRTGCGSSCSSSSRPFTDWAGGSGWTNPKDIINGAATDATTGNTNPVDLYANLDGNSAGGTDPLPYDWHRTLEDIGIVVWGAGTSSTPADRIIDLCIFLNPATGCASNTIQVTLPTGSAAKPVLSGSTDPDQPFPASFPSSPFYGWTGSISPLIHMENRENFGTVAVSGSSLSLANINYQQHFSAALSTGQKIYLAGSSCTNNLCTLSASPASANAATIQETPGNGTVAFRAYGWGIRVWKNNANGTVKIGTQFKLAGSNSPIGTQPGGDKCSSVQVTSGDGKQGYLCSLTSAVTGFGWLSFVATDGTTRILSYRSGFSFDDIKGNVFYGGTRNSNGGWTILKYTYTGDYSSKVLNYNYTCASAGNCPNAPGDNDITSQDLMPHSSNADLDQQIEANQGTALPAYNSSIYGTWNAGPVGYYGSSGHFAFFCNLYSGQGQPTAGGPGWCASVDLSQTPAKVVRLIHTLDGTGAPNARFGSLHSAQQVDSNPNTLFMSLDPLQANNASTLNGGPFQAKVISVLRADGVTWDSNTCLTWPYGATGSSGCSTNTWYQTCPPGSAPYTTCVTFRLPQGGVCNIAATAPMISAYPCPWSGTASQYPPMHVGDNSVDLVGNPGNIDNEHFHILSLTPDDGNTLRVVAARNGTYDYCSISPWHGQANPLSAQSLNQLYHTNGWTLTMMPGSINSCGAGVLLQDQISGSVQELGHSFANHFQTGRVGSNINFVTGNSVIYNTPFSNLGKVPPAFFSFGSSAFHGINNGGQLQSYTDNSQLGAGESGYQWALDMDPLVSCGAESLGCGGGRTLIAVAGNVYKIQSTGSAVASNATYKIQPMIGWAGRYQLQDLSGPSSSIDTTPYSMCFALLAGECHTGSSPNDVYVNVPTMYDPGYCSASISWANIPCVFFGDNSPGGGMRQFRIYKPDANGSGSRFITNGWSSMGRHYPYTHGTVYQTGQWAMLMGTNSIDGFNMAAFMVALPPWAERRDPNNDFKPVVVQVPPGPRYAEVQFGYSRYLGPGNLLTQGLYCTSRAESCNTSAATLFNFESEARALKVCSTGCKITIPAVAPNLMYYRIRRSADGKTWTNLDIQAVALP